MKRLIIMAGICTLIAGCGVADKRHAKFEPTLESLRQYQCPEWFRDAKIGFWAHWGPQSQPAQGDWYAKGMYIPKGEPGARGQYEYHLKHYGHPSEFGYKDVIKTWKAEKFTPEYADYMMDVYKRAGAKFFVTTVHHHDNFDMWDSKTYRWNSANMGPKKDITQMWQDATRRAGLKFGIASHLNNSESWWDEAKGSDKTGPKAGVSYDGADPKYADLYHPIDQSNYHWQEKWYERVSEITKRTKPDILWFDCKQVPYGEYGMRIISDYYNDNIKRNGSMQAVCALKQLPGEYDVSEISVKDYEYGVPFEGKPYPWISDSFIGHWFWNSDYENGNIPHNEPEFLIAYLIDTVSKNGCVQLDIPQRGDGTVNEKIIASLLKLGAWLNINGEGIYYTRPFRTFGEGPAVFPQSDIDSNLKRGADYSKFRHGKNYYNSKHLRYTQSKDGKTVYAFALAWPDSDMVVFTELASGKSPRKISTVEMLGSNAKLKWERTEAGLEVCLPKVRPCNETFCLKIK